jgi:hypothetical protein
MTAGILIVFFFAILVPVIIFTIVLLIVFCLRRCAHTKRKLQRKYYGKEIEVKSEVEVEEKTKLLI